jgi:hypothetical protein
MTTFRAIIDTAVAEAMSERPKYFTEAGHSHVRKLIVGKIMAMLRETGDKSASDSEQVSPPAPPGPALVAPDSREACASRHLRAAAGAPEPVRCGDGRISIMPESLRADALAFADAPPKERWLFVTDRQQIGAWKEFFRERLPGIPKRTIEIDRAGTTGILVPWPWPPTVEGKVFAAAEESAA